MQDLQSSLESSSNSPDEISNPSEFIPIRYSGESVSEVGRVVRITPFRRNVLTTLHRAHVAEFEEYQWIIKYGNTEVWYEKPGKSHLKQLAMMQSSGCEPSDLLELQNPRPVSLETPRVWASAALTTPTDDDIYDCAAGHSIDSDYSGACHQCTDEKSEAMDSTPLVYCLVLSTCQASDPFIIGAHFNGRQIYKLVKCGSREAAAAEAFYASGVNGWNVAFSCVLRVGETFEERTGATERVDDLWRLAEDSQNEDAVRAFY